MSSDRIKMTDKSSGDKDEKAHLTINSPNLGSLSRLEMWINDHSSPWHFESITVESPTGREAVNFHCRKYFHCQKVIVSIKITKREMTVESQ